MDISKIVKVDDKYIESKEINAKELEFQRDRLVQRKIDHENQIVEIQKAIDKYTLEIEEINTLLK